MNSSHSFDRLFQWAAVVLSRSLPMRWRTRLYTWIRDRTPMADYATTTTRRIVPGLYLKTSQYCAGEGATLRLIALHTSIPVPRVLDVVPGTRPGTWHLLMTELPGCLLQSVWGDLDEGQRHDVASQLRIWIDQLRTIPSPYGDAVCAPGRSYFLCYRCDEDNPTGPFGSVSDFQKHITRIFLPSQLVTPPLAEPLRIARARQPSIRFTHGDLKTHNLMFDQGKLSGVIDWETSGWFPDYWEYTSAHWPFCRNKENIWHECIGQALDHYPEDLEAETALWVAQY